ncbi:dihydrofolate reductase family protein [Marinilactibacillus sp. Marseille-P9653]|uniref:dihydrofolate reductase family protein n=1 Tax=Marinilactibacillus sp. Marseille-P9653 TaxID=2866583 RepID=UPI001CE3E54A|nr:dihydrofolate reductase family protein [Marinilactibacillus sp. Marseille-P9653]
MSGKRKVVLFIATSLDGFIATEEETLEWLFEVEGEGDNGYSAFYDTIDTVLMGKKTYDWILNNHQFTEYPYKDKQSFVFSKLEHKNTDDVQFIKNDIPQFINQLKKNNGKTIWLVGGGQLFTYFLKNKLVDELYVTVAPKIIVTGIPLFNPGSYHVDLTLIGTQTFNQFVELHYKVL